MHLLPQMRVRSSAADPSVKRNTRSHVYFYVHFDLKYLQVQYRYDEQLKIEHLVDYVHCISRKWDSCDGLAVSEHVCRSLP